MKRHLLLSLFACLLSAVASAQRIGPLIDAPWHQGAPFNNHCPLWDGTTPVEVGCVATSLTQIMAYYRYPERTVGDLEGWETEHIKVETVPAGAVIDWDNIRNDYRGGYTDEEADAIADLSLYAAMAAHMNFGPNSSGANTSLYVETVPRVFGYASCVECDRADYTQEGWRQLLINEIENGRPVLYVGHNMDFAGHAYVVDGYDFETGRFHANWGYGGTFDRWVDIDVMGQFEHPDDPTFWGLREALYCNHYALLLHPTEIIVPAADKIEMHEGDVTVERIERVASVHSALGEGDGGAGTPATYLTGGYELIDIHVTNHRDDAIAYTFEMLSNADDEEDELFERADYVALGCIILNPRESRIFRTSARFTKTGRRILRLSNDDVSLLCPTPAVVEEGSRIKADFGNVQCLSVTDTEATLSVDVTRTNGITGTLVTYCLLPEDNDEDWRHWQVFTDADFADSQTVTDVVTFLGLEPSTTYTLRVRCPWDVRAEYTFTTNDAIATDAVEGMPLQLDTKPVRLYDLSGRRINNCQPARFYKNDRLHINH